MDGLRLVFLGGLSGKLSDKQIEEIDGVDILFVPVGEEKNSLAGKQTLEIINQVEPKIIIPMNYQSLSGFLKELGQEEKVPIDKLLMTKDKLPLEKEVVVLNARS